MNNLEFGISVGFSRLTDRTSNDVYLHMANCGSVSMSPSMARHIALQLIMFVDYLESQPAPETSDDE